MASHRLVVGADLVDMFHGSRTDYQDFLAQKAEAQAEKFIDVHMPALRIQMGSEIRRIKMEEGRNFPEMIKDYRKRHLLSLDKMAKKAGLTKATLYRIEHGKNAPNQLTRWKIEKLLNEDN